MDNKVYVLTFIDKNKNPHTMTSYGWAEALNDRDIASVNGWELISLTKLREI